MINTTKFCCFADGYLYIGYLVLQLLMNSLRLFLGLTMSDKIHIK